MALLPVDILAIDQTLIPIDKINLRDTLVWVFSESFQESQNKIWYWPAKGSSTRRAIDEQSLLRPEQVRIELIPGQALEALNIGQSAGCLLPMAVVQKSKLKWEATNVHLNWRWYTKASNPTRQ